MIWALLEITLPLILAVLLGMFIGWLLWRWRRRVITADEWSQHLMVQKSDLDAGAKQPGSGVSDAGADPSLAAAAATENRQQRETLVQQLNLLSEKHNTQKVQLSSVEKSAALLTRELEITRQRLTRQSVLQARLEETGASLTALRQEADTLKADRQQLDIEKQELAVGVAQLGSENKQLKADIQNKTTALQSVKSEAKKEVQNTNARLTALQEKLAGAESRGAEVADLKQQQAGWLKQQSELQEKLAAAQQDADTLSRTKQELATLQSRQATISKEGEEAAARLAADETRYTDLEQQHQKLVESMAEAQEKVTATEQQHRELQQTNTEITRQLQASSSENDSLKSANEKLTQRQQQSEVVIRNLTAELPAEKPQAKPEQTKPGELIQAAASEDIASLEKQLNRLQQKEQTLLQSNKEMQEKLKSTANDREDLMQSKTQLAALQGQYRSVSKKAALFADAEREKNELRSQLSIARSDAEALKKEVDVIKHAQQDARSQGIDVDQLDAKLAEESRLRQQTQEQHRQSLAEVDELTQQLEKAKQTAAESAGLQHELTQKLQSLEEESSNSIASAAELAESRSQIASLQAQLSDSRSLTDELATAKKEIGTLEKQLEGLYLDSEASVPKAKSNPRFSAVVNKAILSASTESSSMKDDYPDNSAVQSLRSNTDEALNPAAKDQAVAKKVEAQPIDNSWQQGTTKLGTAGAAHRDDLKVISGIGPVLEKTLNSFDIISWEQLAALTSEEVSIVDKAIAFPGRIQREQWTEQAAELVSQYPDKDDRPTKKTYAKRQASRTG